MNKIIAITPGEPSGIGPDITLKCLSKKINSKINLLTIGNSENFKILQ